MLLNIGAGREIMNLNKRAAAINIAGECRLPLFCLAVVTAVTTAAGQDYINLNAAF